MSPETAAALEASIGHWYRLLDCKTYADFFAEGTGIAACELCKRHNLAFRATTSYGCEDLCPVKIRTGEDFCKSTPYEAASLQINASQFRFKVIPKQALQDIRPYILAEIEFLESLRDG